MLKKLKTLVVMFSLIIFLRCELKAKPDNAIALTSNEDTAKVQNSTEKDTITNCGLCFEPCVCTISTHKKDKDSKVGVGVGARVMYYGDYGLNFGAFHDLDQNIRTYIAIDRMLITNVKGIKKVSVGVAYSDGKRIGFILSKFI